MGYVYNIIIYIYIYIYIYIRIYQNINITKKTCRIKIVPTNCSPVRLNN